MNKQDLINRLAEKAGLSNRAASTALDALTITISQELAKGNEVTLPGIGKLSVKAKPARKGRNPKTGDAMDIPAKTVPHFSAAKALKDAVNS